MKKWPAKKYIKQSIGRVNSLGKSKVFCIGLNKTGTSSVKEAYKDHGFIVGDQSVARDLLYPWIRRDFKPILDYCKTAQAFQDSPFSFPFTYIALDQAFPNSKFILTIRDDPEQWYSSLTRFHAKLWGNDSIPTKDDLQMAVNGEKGRPWVVNRALFNSPEHEPYKKDVLISFYIDHGRQVKEYFKYRPDDLLVLNLSDSDAYLHFCNFLGVTPVAEKFPWVNRT